ncbi:MAG: hypothetical protein HRT94_06915 [Alphaproteobacteria bacterium]|nr:hypothetical protein [Alphaproteobacteria bacterium]
MRVSALKESHLQAVQEVPYKSEDQTAFEEAVTRADAHTWLSTQGLGYFNAQDLHEYLITRNASPKPFLLKEKGMEEALESFSPDVEDIKATLKDNAFYWALYKVAKHKPNQLPQVYRDAMACPKTGFGPILQDALKAGI